MNKQLWDECFEDMTVPVENAITALSDYIEFLENKVIAGTVVEAYDAMSVMEESTNTENDNVLVVKATGTMNFQTPQPQEHECSKCGKKMRLCECSKCKDKINYNICNECWAGVVNG